MAIEWVANNDCSYVAGKRCHQRTEHNPRPVKPRQKHQ
jgi:hypothetical protein